MISETYWRRATGVGNWAMDALISFFFLVSSNCLIFHFYDDLQLTLFIGFRGFGLVEEPRGKEGLDISGPGNGDCACFGVVFNGIDISGIIIDNGFSDLVQNSFCKVHTDCGVPIPFTANETRYFQCFEFRYLLQYTFIISKAYINYGNASDWRG